MVKRLRFHRQKSNGNAGSSAMASKKRTKPSRAAVQKARQKQEARAAAEGHPNLQHLVETGQLNVSELVDQLMERAKSTMPRTKLGNEEYAGILQDAYKHHAAAASLGPAQQDSVRATLKGRLEEEFGVERPRDDLRRLILRSFIWYGEDGRRDLSRDALALEHATNEGIPLDQFKSRLLEPETGGKDRWSRLARAASRNQKLAAVQAQEREKDLIVDDLAHNEFTPPIRYAGRVEGSFEPDAKCVYLVLATIDESSNEAVVQSIQAFPNDVGITDMEGIKKLLSHFCSYLYNPLD